MNTPAPPTFDDGRFVSSASGLMVPRSYQQHQMTQVIHGNSIINAQGFNQGYSLPRDERTLIIRWFQKGSGLDDYFNSKIGDGTIGNIGISPVISPLITTILQKQVTQAATASIELTGRKSTVRRAREAVSRFDDSPLGATDAIMQIVRNLRTYNRGAPIATVPIMYDMEQWTQYGMNAIPIKGMKGEKYFYLDVDWKKAGGPVPFLPSVFDLEPTGMKEFPYWYHATSGKERKWVLLHKTQCIPITPGKSEFYGIGTSSIWMCLKHIAEDILEDDRRIELLVNSLADGLLGIGPVLLNADSIKAQLDENAEDSERQGNIAVKGYVMLTSPTGQIKFDEYSFRKETGIPYTEKLQASEDHVARAFQEALSGVATRGGVGYGAQAGTVADESSAGGVEYILQMLTVALGTIYPRVKVAVKRKNDRAQRLNFQGMKTFSETYKNLNAYGTVISPDMARAIIDREFVDLPSVTEGVIHTTATGDEDASQENQVQENGDPESSGDKKQDEKPVDENLTAMFAIARNLKKVQPDGSDAPLPELIVTPEIVSTTEFDQYWTDEDYPGMLESQVFDTEDEVDDENKGRWVWIAGAWVYLIATQERRVDRNESVDIRDTMVDQRQPTMLDLVDDMIAGVITIQTFHKAGWNVNQEGDTNSFRLGRGGVNAMTAFDDGLLVSLLEDELQAWNDFVQRISDGLYTEKQIRNYARGFVNAQTTFYERGNAESYGLPVLSQYPGDGQTQCHRGCKCHLDILPLTGNGNFDVRWLLGRAEHCPDCIRLSREWNPLRIRGGVIL